MEQDDSTGDTIQKVTFKFLHFCFQFLSPVKNKTLTDHFLNRITLYEKAPENPSGHFKERTLHKFRAYETNMPPNLKT